MKQWIAAKFAIGVFRLRVYKLNEKKDFYTIEGSDIGHHADWVKEHPELYLFGDTREEVEEEILERIKHF
jgi:hypothetical protein